MAVRRIITAAGLTVLLCFCCCSDSPTEGGQGTPGMPNAIGMFWEYEVYDSLTQTTDTAVVSITDTVVDEQSSKYLLWRTYFRSSGLVQEKVGAATGDTFAYFITPDDKITGTFILEQFPFPLTSGKEWYNGLFAGNSKVLDVVTLTVPAMTFHDVAVVQHTDNLEGLSRTVTNCVAAGIGIVAYHEYQVRTSEPAGEVTANVTWRLLRYDLSTFPLSRFPLNEGTRWEYEVIDGDTLVTDTIRVTIGNRVSVPGPGSVHVWHFVGRSAHDSVFVFMLGQNLYFSQDAVLDTYESWVFAFPLAVGRYWGTEPWVIADINDKGPLSTSAGDFRTSFHHVRFEIRDGAPMVNKTIEEWLVPGVGIAARRFTTLGLGGPNHRIDWRLIEFMSR